MKITCSLCGKPVSTEVPDDTIIDAYVECLECAEDEVCPICMKEDCSPDCEAYEAGYD